MAAVSRTPNLKTTSSPQQRTYPNPTRRPLTPSIERDNNGNVAPVRKPRPRDVASRYLSTSSSSSSSSNSASSASTLSNSSSCLPSLRRCPSPIIPRSTSDVATTPATTTAAPTRGLVTRRAQSVERRRAPTPRPAAELSTAAAKQLLLTSSKRSLSVSFQGESYSMPFNKTKPAVVAVTAAASTPNLRKPTPERKRQPSTPRTQQQQQPQPQPPRREGAADTAHRENANSRPPGLDQFHLPWPTARSRQLANASVQPLSKSVDLSAERRKLMSGSGRVVRALQKSLTAEGGEGFIRPTTTSSSSSSLELRRTQTSSGDNTTVRTARSFSRLSDSMASDTESVCSDSNSGRGGGGGGGIVIPARYLQDRRPPVSSSPLTRSNSMGRIASLPSSSKLSVSKKLMCNSLSPSSSPSPKGAVLSRGLSPLRGGGGGIRPASPLTGGSGVRPASPLTVGSGVRPASPLTGSGGVRAASPLRSGSGGLRPASPSRLSTQSLDRPSSSRGMGGASPSRMRNSTTGGGSGAVCVNGGSSSSSNMSCAPSVLNFAATIRRVAKVGDNRISDAHLLRIIHNRQLQWRFINARAEDVLAVQKFNAEMILFSTWKSTSDLCSIVSSKRLELARLRLKLKLTAILKEQMPYLEDWDMMDKDHSNSLLGAIDSLEASTLRLPVVCGARADIQGLKDAICSAVDVLHAMSYSVCSMLMKVEEVNRLASEVASLSSKEHALLDECKDILSALASMQVKDCSMRTHVLQLKRELSTSFAVEA